MGTLGTFHAPRFWRPDVNNSHIVRLSLFICHLGSNPTPTPHPSLPGAAHSKHRPLQTTTSPHHHKPPPRTPPQTTASQTTTNHRLPHHHKPPHPTPPQTTAPRAAQPSVPDHQKTAPPSTTPPQATSPTPRPTTAPRAAQPSVPHSLNPTCRQAAHTGHILHERVSFFG